MTHVTTGKKYNTSKIANVECKKNGSLKNIDIKGECFLLIFLKSGSLTFSLNEGMSCLSAPSFICFDESENPTCIANQNAEYYCIYFHPNYLNINMSFELLRSAEYEEIANVHDMFLLKPFIDRCLNVPICESYINSIEDACIQMEKELTQQRDWYWSCRGRSYFMVVIMALERMYDLFGYEKRQITEDTQITVQDKRLMDALLYIESHYMDDLNLKDICNASGVNHTTLTALAKQELGSTIIEYLTEYRIMVSKKQLTFTDIPIKEVAHRTGFKRVHHFSRVFKEVTGETPAVYRKESIQNRKNQEGFM